MERKGQGNKKSEGFSEHWTHLKDTTTSHGIPHVTIARGVVKKTFWGTISLVTLSLMLLNLQGVMVNYFSYNVVIHTELIRRRHQSFPAVTVCNTNPLKNSSLFNSAAFSSLYTILDEGNLTAKKEYSSHKTRFSDLKTRTKRAAGDCEVHPESGFCFALTRDSSAQLFAPSGLQTECEADYGALAMPNSESKAHFLSAVVGPSLLSTGQYYIGIDNGRWANSVAVQQFDRYSVSPNFTTTPCVAADRDTGHNWSAVLCSGDLRYAACQKLAACAHTPYYDVTSGNEICFFLFDTWTRAGFHKASYLCRQLDTKANISLAVIDSADKLEHIINLDMFKSSFSTHDQYWLGLANMTGTWRWEDSSSLDFSNWKNSREPTTECIAGNLTENHVWRGSDCNEEHLILCQWTYKKTTVTTEATQTRATVQVPQPVPGSIYPERILPTHDFRIEEKFTETLVSLDAETRASLGYQATDLILDCQYAGFPCDAERDFFMFFNGVHGNCFTFNKNSSDDALTAYNVGRRYGLKMTLNIDQDEYLKSVGTVAGVRLVVHEQDHMPFPEDEGILATPGRLTSIGVKKLEMNRLNGNYGNCVSYGEINIKRSVYEEYDAVNYTMNGCLKTCYQRHVIEECACADFSVRHYGAAFNYVEVPICNSSNITQDDCRYGVTQKFLHNELVCDCPQQCRSVVYHPQVSNAIWPPDVQRNSTEKRYENVAPNAFSDPSDDDKMYRNLLRVEVYFNSFTEQKQTEIPAYTLVSFLSNIGGTLGLYLAFSLLTIFEFVEFLTDIALWLFTRRKLKSSASTDPGDFMLSAKSGQEIQAGSGITCARPSTSRTRLVSVGNGSDVSTITPIGY